MSLQSIKDTFYTTLRDRVAQGNPARTTVIRGLIRPAILVAENELPGATVDGVAQPDTFVLHWTSLATDAQGLAHLRCEIRYSTGGSAGTAGMDRGRALSTLDDEITQAVNASPQSAELAVAAEIAGGGATVSTDAGTRIFWSDAAFLPVTTRAERLERTATVEVFGYE